MAYIEAALEMACYDKLEDRSFSGEIPKLKGVIAFGKSQAAGHCRPKVDRAAWRL
jgi:predicted RNase H-like HicB family nuclease